MSNVSQGKSRDSARGFTLDPMLRFLNIWFVTAALFGLAGLALGLMKAAPHQYMERNLPGVMLAAVQAQLGPALANGLAFGIWLAILAMTARALGDRRRLKLAILFTIWIIAAPAGYLTQMYYGKGSELFGARLIVKWGGAQEVIKSIVSFGLEQEPLRFRVTAVTIFGLCSAAILLLLHFGFRRILKAKTQARPAKRPSRAAAPAAVVLILIFATMLGRNATKAAPVGSPDVILISIDTLRADHLSCYGYERNTSPNLDRLAEDGVLVENFISHAPWTLPSHASIFTGKLPYEHGAVEPLTSLNPKMGVFPEMIKQKGYRTGGYVTGILVSQKFGFDRGFDVYSFKDYQDAATTAREAAGWFMRERTPSFLFLHLFDLHYPYNPPPVFYTQFGPPTPFLQAGAGIDFGSYLVWAQRAPEHAARASIDRYDELILFVDFVLGKFFEELKKVGRYENTMIVVLSDHGEEFNDHGAWGHSQHLYDESIRVPLIIKFPRSACAGARLTDYSLPARAVPELIMAVAGQVPVMNLRLECGERGVPELMDPLATTGPVISETQFSWISSHQGAHRFSARTTTQKLLEPYRPRSKSLEIFGHDWLMFDLAEDPHETRNIYTPEAAAELDKTIAAQNEKLASKIEEGSTTTLDNETIERLRSLGYLQ